MELTADIVVKLGGADFALKKRIELLKAIEKTGSILQAAKEVPMSYKSAWDTVDLMNNLSPEPVMLRQAGGRSGGGSTLTEHGKNIVRIYEKIESLQGEFMKFIETNADIKSGEISNLQRIAMQISARNVFSGKVAKITHGAVNSSVLLEIKGGVLISSTITKTSAESLGLEVGGEAKAIIKSSSVMISTSDDLAISARNIIKGEICEILRGEVNCEVSLDIGHGQTLASVITLNSADKLGLKVGETAFGIVKSSEVMIGL